MNGAPADHGPPRRRARPAWWLVTAISIAWLLWAIGQLARDRNWLTGLCFYIPSPAMAALAIAAAVAAAGARQRLPAIVLALLALPPCAMVLFVENRWTGPAEVELSGGSIRLVHWNVAYGTWGQAGFEREVVRREASVYVLSETPRTVDLPALAARIGPRYDVARVGAMVFLAEGRLVGARRLVNQGGLKVNAVTWEGRWGPVRIVGVDGPSDLDLPRDPLMRRVRSVIEQHRPDLVVGDFNAPRRSRALWPPPGGYAHAYERVGRGWSYTWPVVCPLFAIDQCLVGQTVRPVRYRLRASRYSDHLMQELEFQLAGARTTPTAEIRAGAAATRAGPPP